MHRETLVYRCFLKGQLEVEGDEDQRYQMLATEVRAVAASPAADAAAEFASAVVAIAAPCDDVDRTADPRRIDFEATICPSHRTGLIDLVCS